MLQFIDIFQKIIQMIIFQYAIIDINFEFVSPVTRNTADIAVLSIKIAIYQMELNYVSPKLTMNQTQNVYVINVIQKLILQNHVVIVIRKSILIQNLI